MERVPRTRTTIKAERVSIVVSRKAIAGGVEPTRHESEISAVAAARQFLEIHSEEFERRPLSRLALLDARKGVGACLKALGRLLHLPVSRHDMTRFTLRRR